MNHNALHVARYPVSLLHVQGCHCVMSTALQERPSKQFCSVQCSVQHCFDSYSFFSFCCKTLQLPIERMHSSNRDPAPDQKFLVSVTTFYFNVPYTCCTLSEKLKSSVQDLQEVSFHSPTASSHQSEYAFLFHLLERSHR